jgi:hypothetical protein
LNYPESAKYAAYIINLLYAKIPAKPVFAPDEEDYLSGTKSLYETQLLGASCPHAVSLANTPSRVPPVPKIKDKKVINRLFVMKNVLYQIFGIPNHITIYGLADLAYLPSPAFKRFLVLEAHKVLNKLS